MSVDTSGTDRRTTAGNGTSSMTDKDAVEYFDTNAKYYEQAQYGATRRTFMRARQEKILDILDGLGLDARAAVLDAGCGPGNLTVEFARRGWRVHAMDASGKMVELARTNTRSVAGARASFYRGSIESLPFADGTFDVVCSAGVIEYLDDYAPAVREFHRVLKPGGLLILPTTNLLAPAYYLRPVLETLGKIPVVARMLGLKPRLFRVKLHFIPKLRRTIQSSRFAIEQEHYFYMTVPRPFNKLAPELSNALERYLDRYATSPIRHFTEGWLAVGRK